MWSDGFSAQLVRLVTHPIWPTSYPGALAAALATAIQYTVILRTGDQRAWDPTSGSHDPFLEAMRDASGTATAAMQQVHAEARRALATNKVPIPIMSLPSLFLELENDIRVSSEPADAGRFFGVTTRDLKKLEIALDRLATRAGMLMTEAHCQTVLAARNTYPPPSLTELPQYHDEAMLEECQRSVAFADTHLTPGTGWTLRADRAARESQASGPPCAALDDMLDLVEEDCAMPRVSPLRKQAWYAHAPAPVEGGVLEATAIWKSKRE